MTPWAHALSGVLLREACARCGWRLSLRGVVLGSVLPDIDFLLFVPWLGRARGHRTITHAPLVQLGIAWLLRRYGFGAVLLGQVLHSLTDSLGRGTPSGVAWLYPFVRRRLSFRELGEIAGIMQRQPSEKR